MSSDEEEEQRYDVSVSGTTSALSESMISEDLKSHENSDAI
jgi:hypothetical protein